MATAGQRLLAVLWWGPLRRVVEAVARRLLAGRRRVLTGPLRGVDVGAAGLAQILGVYELPVQDALWRHLRPGQVAWDVGGHLGFLALLAARRVGPAGSVVVFEPMEESRRHVERLITGQGLDHVEVVPNAAADVDGEMEFFVPRESTVASLTPTEGATSRRVQAVTLDGFAAGRRPPDLIKIDVEGAEARVLAGARRLLREVRPVLVVEIHDPVADDEVRQILRSAEYGVEPLSARSSRTSDYPRHAVARHALARGGSTAR